MTRYFFHSDNGAAHHDAEGLDLPTEQAAEMEAIRLLGELLSDHPKAFWRSRRMTVSVTDGGARIVFQLQTRVVAPS